MNSQELKSPFEVLYNEELDCIFTELNGALNPEVVGAFFSEVGRVAKQHNCQRVLSNLRNAWIDASNSEMYYMAKNMDSKGVMQTFKRALIISRDKQGYEFWENVSVNMGYQKIKLFDNYDDALEWILAE